MTSRELLDRLDGVKRSGKGWIARCPAHADDTPSLSVAIGDSGDIVMHCFAGCRADAICNAMGVQLSDLRAGANGSHGQAKQAPRPTAAPTPDFAAIATRYEHALVDELASDEAARLGVAVEALRQLRAGWDAERGALAVPERGADGQLVGINLRAAHGSRTHRGKRGIIAPEAIDSHAPLYVVEGGTDTLAALSIGLNAIGRPSCTGGLEMVRSFVKRRGIAHVVIVSDADHAGRRGAAQLARALSGDGLAVRIIEPPAPHKDLREWLRAGATRETVDQLANDAAPWSPSTKPANSPGSAGVPSTHASSALRKLSAIPSWRPFPVEAFPKPIAQFVRDQAAAHGDDPAMLALPVIGVLAGAIGTTRRIELKRSWREPCVAWCVLVVKSGTRKSPAVEAALEPVNALQRKAYEAAKAMLPDFKAKRAKYKREFAAWKKSKYEGSEPEQPAPPVPERYVVEDTTTEALVARLADQRDGRGLLLARDEWSGLLAFDAYKTTKGADVAAYLKMYGARDVYVDRKTGDRTHIFAPRAALSIVGGIQPRTLVRGLGSQHFENGFAARCLFAMPPVRRKPWSKRAPSPRCVGDYHRVVQQLYRLRHRTGFGDDNVPVDVPLSDEAESVWASFYNQFGGVQLDAPDDDLGAAYAKLEGYAARFALIVHCVRGIDDPAVTDDAIDADSVRAGIALSQWFANETQRVYAALRENEEQAEARWLLEWVQRHGGSTTARDLARARRRYATVDDARAALEQLAAAGLGRWVHREPGPDGGRPSDAFELMPRADETPDPTPETELRADETPEIHETSDGSVNVDSVDTCASNGDDDGFVDGFTGYVDDPDPEDCDAI